MSADKTIVMCGCLETGWYLMRDLLSTGLKIDYFVTLTREQAIENSVSGFRDFTDLARAHGIPVYVPRSYSLKHPDDVRFFETHRFDLVLQGGWQRLFPAQVLSTLSVGAVGLHGGADFLPKGRGRSPLNWSIIEGKRRFLMQLFLIRTEAVDEGDILDSEPFDITPFDTIRTLYYKNTIVTKRMLLRSLPGLLGGTIQGRPQVGTPSFYRKRDEQDGTIDWETMDVWHIHDLVRASTHPYPGAHAMIGGRLHKIWRAQVFDTRIEYPGQPYGSIVETFDDAIVVRCPGGLLLIHEYEPC